MASRGGGPIRFGSFELDTTTGELRKRGVKLNLPEQAFRVLHALVERPGEVVSRGELQGRLWPDRTFVDFDTAINKCVSHLRSLLGDSGTASRFIETLPRRGYRFVAPVHLDPPATRGSGVVVLPFENLTGDTACTFVAEGVTHGRAPGALSCAAEIRLAPSGGTRHLIDADHSVWGFAWTPDSRELVFSHGGHLSLSRMSRIPVVPHSSRPPEPEFLTFGEQATGFSIAGNGRLVYSAQFRDTTLYELAHAGAPATPVALAAFSSTFDEHTPHVSPDGRRLAFASTRSGSEEI